jgi:hypothetical protein
VRLFEEMFEKMKTGQELPGGYKMLRQLFLAHGMYPRLKPVTKRTKKKSKVFDLQQEMSRQGTP